MLSERPCSPLWLSSHSFLLESSVSKWTHFTSDWKRSFSCLSCFFLNKELASRDIQRALIRSVKITLTSLTTVLGMNWYDFQKRDSNKTFLPYQWAGGGTCRSSLPDYVYTSARYWNHNTVYHLLMRTGCLHVLCRRVKDSRSLLRRRKVGRADINRQCVRDDIEEDVDKGTLYHLPRLNTYK